MTSSRVAGFCLGDIVDMVVMWFSHVPVIFEARPTTGAREHACVCIDTVMASEKAWGNCVAVPHPKRQRNYITGVHASTSSISSSIILD